MVEESSPLSRAAEESTDAKEENAAEPDSERDGYATEPKGDAFVCECSESNEVMRSACKGGPFYKEHESKRYCVLHYPGKEKTAAFEKALQRKLVANDFNFDGVWFPDKVDFSYFIFKANANFNFATFSADVVFNFATFGAEAGFSFATLSAGASFYSAVFSATSNFGSTEFIADANFYYARFNGNAHFSSSKFKANANFTYAKFNMPVSFSGAEFSENASFGSATFNASAYFDRSAFNKEGYFNRTTFNDSLSFSGTGDERSVKDGTRLEKRALGTDPSLDFQYAIFERPERVSFHTVTLRPHWFVNVDVREFVFTNVDWRHPALEQEVNSLEARFVASPHQAMAIAYRQIAINAEENHRYDEASSFRYWSMAVRRQERWYRFRLWRLWKRALSGRWSHLNEKQTVVFIRRDALVHWLYWVVSGYGERMLRPFVWLLGIWIVFALFYTQTGFTRPEMTSSMKSEAAAAKPDEVGEPLPLKRAVTYSLGVMSLQRPEPRPLTNWAHALVTLETILGPVQAALLALAIRRRFMR